LNLKLNRNFNADAFRKWITTQFFKEDLKKHNLRAGTVKKVYHLLCGMVTAKNPKIFNKTVDYIARNSRLCKESTLKALDFLHDFKFISIDKGRGRRSNAYHHYLKETGIMCTKNGRKLPYLNFRDHLLLKSLADSRVFKGTTFSVLQMILVFAGMKNGQFTASKETLENYTQLDRRTIDKAFRALIEAKILNKIPFPTIEKDGVNQRSPYNRGNFAYTVNRKALESLCFKTPVYKKPKAAAKKEEFGPPDGFDLIEEVKKYKLAKAAANTA